jgi:hypothetical protein
VGPWPCLAWRGRRGDTDSSRCRPAEAMASSARGAAVRADRTPRRRGREPEGERGLATSLGRAAAAAITSLRNVSYRGKWGRCSDHAPCRLRRPAKAARLGPKTGVRAHGVPTALGSSRRPRASTRTWTGRRRGHDGVTARPSSDLASHAAPDRLRSSAVPFRLGHRFVSACVGRTSACSLRVPSSPRRPELPLADKGPKLHADVTVADQTGRFASHAAPRLAVHGPLVGLVLLPSPDRSPRELLAGDPAYPLRPSPGRNVILRAIPGAPRSSRRRSLFGRSRRPTLPSRDDVRRRDSPGSVAAWRHGRPLPRVTRDREGLCGFLQRFRAFLPLPPRSPRGQARTTAVR